MEEPVSQPTVKRFHLQREPSINNRLRFVQREFKAYMASHLEVVGVTFMASNINGTAREDSDLDCFVYVDADNPNIKKPTHSQSRRARLAHIMMVRSPHRITLTRRDCLFKEMYRPEVVQLVKDAGFHCAENYKDVRVCQISERALRRQLDLFIAHAEAYYELLNRYRQAQATYDKAVAENDNSQRRLELISAVPPYPSYDVKASFPWKYEALFYLSIGNGLNHYRKIILDALSKSRFGDDIWRAAFVSSMKDAEYSKDTVSRKSYPQTVDEAYAHYHITKE